LTKWWGSGIIRPAGVRPVVAGETPTCSGVKLDEDSIMDGIMSEQTQQSVKPSPVAARDEKGVSVREITYAQAVREALRQAMQADERVFLFGEDVGVYGGAFGVSDGLLEEFGAERVRDTPISEAAIAGAAIGAAVTGMRPVAEIQFMDFITLSMEQLVLQGAKMRFMFGGKARVPMVLRTPAGSGTGAAAQHSESLEAWFVHVPGLKVVMPSTPYDVKGLLLAAIEDDNPVIFVEHKLLYRTKGPVPEEYYTVPLTQSDVKRQGTDLTVVATSIMVPRALEAAEQLAAEGIELEVIDPRTLKPYDAQPMISSVIKTGKALVVHEAPITGGFGGEVVAQLVASEAFDYLDAPVRRLAGLDVPIPYNRELERRAVPQVEDIVREGRALVRGEY
jgi:pyruvate/2-oxoglutarate/acetoin dehydrogenase E1 component